VARKTSIVVRALVGLVVLAAPASALDTPEPPAPPRPPNGAPAGPKWAPQSPPPQARWASGGYRAYVALAGGFNVSIVDAASHRVIRTGIATDAAQGVAVTPDGRKLYIANTGQYDVLVVDLVRNTRRRVHVGPFPHDVAVSPDGSRVYATVTGGNTGSGGSDTVAVIDTGTDRMTGAIHVGNAPREVVFGHDRAYVSYDRGVAVIDARTDRVVSRIADAEGPQGLALDPAGRTLYVTNPRAGDVWLLDTASGAVRARIPVGEGPWGVAVTPDGAKAYVAVMNDNAVAVIDTARRRVSRTIAVGRLPSTVAVTPDGSEVWVGNALTGTVSVIAVGGDAVRTAVGGGAKAARVDAAPVAIAFGVAPPRPGRRRETTVRRRGCAGCSVPAEHGLDLQPYFDLVTEHDAVPLQRDVELDVEFRPQNLRGRDESGADVAPLVDARAVELCEEADRPGDVADCEVSVDGVAAVASASAGAGGRDAGGDERDDREGRHVDDLR
jgi:YVTN family beta-propeller protein